jgi:hypothetical protein
MGGEDRGLYRAWLGVGLPLHWPFLHIPGGDGVGRGLRGAGTHSKSGAQQFKVSLHLSEPQFHTVNQRPQVWPPRVC